MSLREKYLASKASVVGSVDIPDWGKVHIRSLSLSDMEKMKDKGDVEAVLWSILLGVCDEVGNKVFGPDDWEFIKGLPWLIVQPLAEAVSRFNKLSAEIVADEKKDCEKTMKQDSCSDCASSSEQPLLS